MIGERVRIDVGWDLVTTGMLRTRMKRLANRGEAAVGRLAAIEVSIANLGDEDLLDPAIVQPDVWKLMRAEITHPGDSI